jgi:hypothetical protein
MKTGVAPVCFSRNVAIFAGNLSKTAEQLMLVNARNHQNAISAILFLLNRAGNRIAFFSAPHERLFGG